MKKINILDRHISELIAAGEVVERPSSVVKELIENSIDSGANKIDVEIEKGGTSFIRISDNGFGIYKDDVKNAFLRHATSKIGGESDLESISTLGFRGEALSSISAVSRVELITCAFGENIGTRYIINGGEESLAEDSARSRGSTIIVRDLFFNTPARMKFLKKDVAEGNSVSGIIDRIALSRPEISFKFIRDGKEILCTPGDSRISSSIYSIYGREFFSGMIPVESEFNGLKIIGYISKPVASRSNRSMQHFFINGRYVKTKTASVALEEAFKGSVTVGKYPYCVLHIEIPFNYVDVNVHPSKIEVRFIDEKPIFDIIYNGVKASLSKYDEKKRMDLKSIIQKDNPIVNVPRPIVNNKGNISSGIKETIKAQPSYVSMSDSVKKPRVTANNDFEIEIPYTSGIKHRGSFKKNSFKQTRNERISDNSDINLQKTTNKGIENKEFKSKPLCCDSIDNNKTDILDIINDNQPCKKETNRIQQLSFIKSYSKKADKKVIGEVFDCYIIVQSDNGDLILIDKHAAHERIIYDKLKSEQGNVDSQVLAESVIVTLDKNEYSAIIENTNLLMESGYGIEDFGPGTIIVRSAPVYLNISDVKDSVSEIAGYILKNKKDINTKYTEWLYHNIACRAAIKGGKSSSYQEMVSLVDKLENNEDIKYCPHGRPVYVVIKKNDIEKQFSRT